MIKITEDSVAIEQDNREITFNATGGPEEPIEVCLAESSLLILLYREDIDRSQSVFVDFLNTGYFDQEG